MPGYLIQNLGSNALNVSLIPSGNISSSNVDSAIQELDSEKEKSIPLQSSAPSSPATSDLWVDNTISSKPILKVYDGTSWVVAGSSIEVDDDQLILAQRMFA